MTHPPAPCVILGSGNIGTDLMLKLRRTPALRLDAVVGIDPRSEGLARASADGVTTAVTGAEWILQHAAPGTVVFDATSAAAHRAHGPRLIEAGMRVIDLTPAGTGPGVVPAVNLDPVAAEPEVNLVSCGGQATVPIVHAIARACPVSYAEIVSTIASRSAGPGTRANIDEFTRTTGCALSTIGGAGRGKAIIILNPAEPPILMRNTVHCTIPGDADRDAIDTSIRRTVSDVAQYVPGYRLRTDPIFDEGRVSVLLEVEGAGDYLPPYAGNLDIITAAAVRVATYAGAHQEATA